MECPICQGDTRGHKYCTPCYLSFIQKIPSVPPGGIKGGGEYIDAISRNMGQSAEDEFFHLNKMQHKFIRSATRYENIKKHFDFILYEQLLSKYIKVEVKSMKARHRGEAPDPSIIYIEIFNIDGYPGWVYGESDYIAFQRPDGFLLVQTKSLINIVNYYYHHLPYVTKSGIEYTLYGRNNRKDLVLILPFKEIENIKNNIRIN